LRDHQEQLSKAGVAVAAVGTGDAAVAGEFKTKYGLKFPVLVDDELLSYRAVQVKKSSQLNWVNPKVLTASVRALSSGAISGIGSPMGKHTEFLGATHVIRPDGNVPFAWINDDFGDNSDVDEVVEVAVSGG
jgi:peroxiredoxin